MAPDPVTEAKKAMRAAAKAARSRAFACDGGHAGQAIAAHGIAFSGVEAPAMVSGFLPIGEEIDPMPLLLRLRDEGFGLCLPVMEGRGTPLVFRAWAPGDALVATTWGIREPRASAPAVEPDVVLGPLLAFDRAGHRLGYGGGFYDRTLARLRALKPIVSVGLAYDEQRVDAVPHLDYDQRLDWVLTPSGPMRCQ